MRKFRILALSTEQLVQRFEAELPDHANQDCLYARNLVEYCSYRALHEETKHPDHLADNEFRVLTFDMMLAWETPDTEKESMLNVRHRYISTSLYMSSFFFFWPFAYHPLLLILRFVYVEQQELLL